MKPRPILILLLLLSHLLSAGPASAQDKGSVNPKPLPPLANPNDPKLGAKELFARKVLPAAMPTRVIGFYAKGCIAGAEQMPINGDTWQVMRLSRNRYWGHPDMIALVKRLAAKAHKDAGWPGILVGDIGAAARRPDADRPRQPPDRARCRHLADADAGSPIVARGARGDVGGHDGARGPARRRSEGLHAGSCCSCSATPRRSRPCSGYSSMPRSRRRCAARPRATAAGFPRSGRWWGHDYHFHIRMRCPPGSRRMRRPAIAVGGAKAASRPISLLVQGFGPASQAAAETAEAEAADDAGAVARRLQGGAECAGREAIAPQSVFIPAPVELMRYHAPQCFEQMHRRRRQCRMNTMRGTTMRTQCTQPDQGHRRRSDEGRDHVAYPRRYRRQGHDVLHHQRSRR